MTDPPRFNCKRAIFYPFGVSWINRFLRTPDSDPKCASSPTHPLSLSVTVRIMRGTDHSCVVCGVSWQSPSVISGTKEYWTSTAFASSIGLCRSLFTYFFFRACLSRGNPPPTENRVSETRAPPPHAQTTSRSPKNRSPI